MERCVLLQHDQAQEDLKKVTGGADSWNSHTPNTELIEVGKRGAKLWLGGIESATAAGRQNPDNVRLVCDARGFSCQSQNVRGQRSPTPGEYRANGVQHCFFETNRHLRKPGHGAWCAITDLASITAHLLVVLECIAAGGSIQFHCNSPLFPLHRFFHRALFSIARLPRPFLNNRVCRMGYGRDRTGSERVGHDHGRSRGETMTPPAPRIGNDCQIHPYP